MTFKQAFRHLQKNYTKVSLSYTETDGHEYPCIGAHGNGGCGMGASFEEAFRNLDQSIFRDRRRPTMHHKITSGGDTNCVCLKPGIPGFEDMAVQVTPLNKIRKPYIPISTIWPEEPQSGRITRNETMDKGRGK